MQSLYREVIDNKEGPLLVEVVLYIIIYHYCTIEWLRQAVHKLVKARREVLQLEEERKFARDIKLADAGVDPRWAWLNHITMPTSLSI